ncbi:hypothetical protein [Corynebacterium sp.]|uniref:LptM family lipoprotein n=1 Tax=Corynebacterium sp. TaxID=1720 RepID=UPI002A9165AF|nr:hypothetical protein [Corynebacterium sp.]MDY5784775.1 hypothetical protein [Corynebacterium sp.]
MKKLFLCLLLGGAFFSLTACGNAVYTDISGQVGFSLNESGGVIVEVESCGIELDGVDLAGPNINGENHKYASFKAKVPVSGYFNVDISNPDSNWQSESPVETPENADELLIANASTSREDIQPYPADAKLSEIRALKPGEIIIGSSESSVDETSREIVTREEFSRCERTG